MKYINLQKAADREFQDESSIKVADLNDPPALCFIIIFHPTVYAGRENMVGTFNSIPQMSKLALLTTQPF